MSSYKGGITEIFDECRFTNITKWQREKLWLKMEIFFLDIFLQQTMLMQKPGDLALFSLPSPFSPSLSPPVWLCGIELLIRIVAGPNEFRPSSFCNGAADPTLWALILLSSAWWKNHLAAIQRSHPLTKPRKGDQHNGQIYCAFFLSSLLITAFFFLHLHAFKLCNHLESIGLNNKRNILL